MNESGENKVTAAGPAEASTPDVLYRERLGKLLELTAAEEKRLKKFLKKNLDQWEQDTQERTDNLIADNDLVENVIEDTGWPYEGAPNIHVPVTSIYMKIFKSVQKRSILGAGDIWHVKLEPEAYGTPLEKIAPEIAEMMNFKAQEEWNIASVLEDVFETTNRDGLGIIKVPYVEEVEHQRDIMIFSSPAEFAAQFPTAKDAGMEQSAYLATLEKLKQATEQTPVEIPVEFDRVVYAGPKGKVVELVNFVTFPANCEDLSREQCKGYGEVFALRRGAVKAKMRSGAWYKEATRKVLKGKNDGGRSDLKKAQDEIEGLGQSDPDEIKFAELVVRFPLKPGEEERQLLVTYAPESDEIVSAMDYPYRLDFYALFRIDKRTGRLVGRSIPSQTRDTNELIDKQTTQRILSRDIATVPSFKGKKSAKGDFDAEAPENRWRPGVIFWLDDPDAFDQFKVQPTDLGESMQESKNAMSTLDLLLGSSAALLSGQAASTDPSAPGNKTAMMINQSNLRMDDPLSTMRQGVDQLGMICLSHLYQFGPPIISYVATGNGVNETKTIQKKLLRSGVRMRMAGVNVVDNPQAEMARWLGIYAQLVAEPEIANNPEARVEIIRLALQSGRVPNRDKILPSPQQIQEKQVAMLVEAQKRLALEAAVKKAAANEERVNQRFGQMRENLSRRKLAQSVVENAAGGQDAAPTE